MLRRIDLYIGLGIRSAALMSMIPLKLTMLKLSTALCLHMFDIKRSALNDRRIYILPKSSKLVR